ncbi:MAG: hypothetical protein ABIH91_00620 [Candidatus Omnitrophota bacterium]
MRNSKKKLFLVLFFFLSIIFAFHAQASNLGLDKSKIRLSIPPEGSEAGEIKIDNFSDETLKVKVYLEDWVYKNTYDGQKNFFFKGTQPLSCSEWISFSSSELTLPPFGKQSVNYVVRVPAQAKGGHYSVMFFETSIGKYNQEASEETEERSVGINVAVRIGALFYVEVKDTIKKEAEVSNLAVSGNTGGNPLLISLDLKNIGNVDITTTPYFHIMDQQGMVYARAEFNEVYTMPGDAAKVTASWTKPISQGVYDLVMTFNLNQAQDAAGARRGPAMIKETRIEIGRDGRIERTGELK